MKPVETFNGPFDRTKLIKIQNKINALWNSYTQADILYTIGVQVIKNDDTDKSYWVDFPKRNPEKIKCIRIYKVRQTPINN